MPRGQTTSQFCGSALFRAMRATWASHYRRIGAVQEVISPAVQVVIVSVWPAVVTGIVTAAVGLVGILAPMFAVSG